MDGTAAKSVSACPAHTTVGGTSNRDWWPKQLDLSILHQGSPLSDPMGASFDYAEEFAKLDLEALKQDLYALMTDSQGGWPTKLATTPLISCRPRSMRSA